MGESAITSGKCVIEVGVLPNPVTASPLAWPGECGAESVFLGRTRRETHPQFGGLVRLEYEAYAPMAEAMLLAFAQAAAERFGCLAIRVAHATGVVNPCEASVVIQVATPHRGEAFAACRYIIDRIKHELPIWKREVWDHGTTFVEGCCAHRDHDATTDAATPERRA